MICTIGCYLFLPPLVRQGVPARRHFSRVVVGGEANPSLEGRQVAILDLLRDLTYLLSRVLVASYTHETTITRTPRALESVAVPSPSGRMNFREFRKTEVQLLRVPLPCTPVNKDMKKSGRRKV